MAVRALYFCSRSFHVKDLLPVFVVPTRQLIAHQSSDSQSEDSQSKDSQSEDVRRKSCVQRTHAITTVEYDMSDSPVRSEFLADYKPLWNIRKQSGAVVRHEEMSNEKREEGDGRERSNKLLIVGNPNQIKLAFSLLNRELDINKSVDVRSEAFRRAFSPYVPFYNFGVHGFEGKKMWEGYRRNFKGQYPPLRPRRDCRTPLRDPYHPKGQCGNPCPLCQMAYLHDYHVHFTDIEIMNHFICPHTGKLYPATRTQICRKQHDLLEALMKKARLHGYLPMALPAPTVKEEKVKFKRAGLPTDRHVKHVRARSWKWGAYRSPKHINRPFKMLQPGR